MFEPLPGIVRLRREQRNMTQAELAARAGVNRGQLVAFEKGEQNVTLTTLLKIARALEMTELPLAELHLRPAAPELTVVIAAAEALAGARRVIMNAMDASGQLESASRTIQTMVDRALQTRETDAGLVEAAQRLFGYLDDRELRSVAERPDAVPERARAKPAAKAAARRRAR